MVIPISRAALLVIGAPLNVETMLLLAQAAYKRVGAAANVWVVVVDSTNVVVIVVETVAVVVLNKVVVVEAGRRLVVIVLVNVGVMVAVAVD